MKAKALNLALILALCAASASARAPWGGPTPPALNPAYMWLCDDGSGLVLSEVYNDQHGTLVNGGGSAIVWSPDAPFPYAGNTSLKLDGIDDHVVLSTQALASGMTSCTVSAWFWRYSDVYLKEYTIWGERDECSFPVYSVGVEQRAGMLPSFRFKDFERFFASPCWTGVLHEAITPMIPSPGVWHHMAAVKDPVSGMTVYVDGAPVASNAYTDAYIGYHAATTLGGTGTTGYDGFWHGQIDEVALFNYSLSPSEVAWLASHSLRELPPPPVAYCTAKINSCGSLPTIYAAGQSRASQSSGFAVIASNWRANKPGLLLYTDGGAHTAPPPFQGGYFCITAPVKRSVTVNSNSGGGGPCDAVIALDMNTFATGSMGSNPLASLSMPGTTIACQWWGRDTIAAGSLLSDGLAYVVGP
jgi:hypothetical protein